MKKVKTESKVIIYSISKVRDSKDMYISIQNGEVEIIAPYNYSNKQIQKVIEEKRDRILKKIAEYNFNNTEDFNGIERKIKIYLWSIKERDN